MASGEDPAGEHSEQIINAPTNLRSAVWKHFGFLKTDSSRDTTVCKLCFAHISYKTGQTTNMSAHLKRKHDMILSKEVEQSSHANKDENNNVLSASKSSSAVAGQLKIKDAFKGKYDMRCAQFQRITNAIGAFIAHDLRPFAVVENSGFKNMINIMDPRYVIPSRTHFATKVIPDMYKTCEKKVREELSEAPFICLTTDAWTSRTADSYNTISAHFIDDKWNLKAYVLQTLKMEEAHTSENLCSMLKCAIEKWDLCKFNMKPALTTDNAANVSKAAMLTGIDIHVRCFAHSLNLATQKSLKVSPLDKLLNKLRKIVSYFHRSNMASSNLKQKQIMLDLPQHKLIHDVSTRWNSTLDMCERFLEQHLAIEAIILGRGLAQKLEIINDEELKILQVVVKLLEPIKSVTTILCNEQTPTLSLISPFKEKLIKQMQRNDGDCELIEFMKKTIREDLSSRYTDPDVIEVLQLSSFLDPRFKSLRHMDDYTKQEIYLSFMRRGLLILQSMDGQTADQPDDHNYSMDAFIFDRPGPSSAPSSLDDTHSIPKQAKRTSIQSMLGDMFDSTPLSKMSLYQLLEKELESYKSEIPLRLDLNPLHWWKDHFQKYPMIGKCARVFLAIQATSVPSERIFSTAGDIVSAQRSSLTPDNVNTLIFLKKNMTLLT